MGPLLSEDRDDLNKERGGIQTLFFDTEGLDGTSDSSTSVGSASSTSSFGGGIHSNLSSLTPSVTQAIASSLIYLTKKRRHVDSSYPKLVYYFRMLFVLLLNRIGKKKLIWIVSLYGLVKVQRISLIEELNPSSNEIK
jgi:hypothetical protein